MDRATTPASTDPLWDIITASIPMIGLREIPSRNSSVVDSAQATATPPEPQAPYAGFEQPSQYAQPPQYATAMAPQQYVPVGYEPTGGASAPVPTNFGTVDPGAYAPPPMMGNRPRARVA